VGPALAVLLGSPSLNPAALALTFLLFQPGVAVARLLMAVTAVFLGSILIERAFPKVALLRRSQPGIAPAPEGSGNVIGRFAGSIASVVVRTVPALILGVIGSMLLVQWLPAGAWTAPESRMISTFAIAAIAVPLALPTFLEIPLAIGLLAAGFPAGAAAAFLFAGPAINLPSLLTIGRITGWKVAVAVAMLVWLVAVTGGLLVG
jgi:uncharacterized membrane protein YraQ (UPF0718 family)